MRKRKAQYLLCLTLRGWAAASPWSAACCNEVLLISGPSLFRVSPLSTQVLTTVSFATAVISARAAVGRRAPPRGGGVLALHSSLLRDLSTEGFTLNSDGPDINRISLQQASDQGEAAAQPLRVRHNRY